MSELTKLAVSYYPPYPKFEVGDCINNQTVIDISDEGELILSDSKGNFSVYSFYGKCITNPKKRPLPGISRVPNDVIVLTGGMNRERYSEHLEKIQDIRDMCKEAGKLFPQSIVKFTFAWRSRDSDEQKAICKRIHLVKSPFIKLSQSGLEISLWGTGHYYSKGWTEYVDSDLINTQFEKHFNTKLCSSFYKEKVYDFGYAFSTGDTTLVIECPSQQELEDFLKNEEK